MYGQVCALIPTHMPFFALLCPTLYFTSAVPPRALYVRTVPVHRAASATATARWDS
ncbi:hypothetical protein BS50DRAFT_232778 [Corynespora cassiicola Philippines]|uniref:Uncharacterized protein n=1 Tax=Corynespora cassiicola Philippines TaxID=1448308 RepID=A0A2T2P1Z3_CORCC|nr:hypothetical protein BS50DRAFT_232778 [Corynespora cassiicola Philippines]